MFKLGTLGRRSFSRPDVTQRLPSHISKIVLSIVKIGPLPLHPGQVKHTHTVWSAEAEPTEQLDG